MGLAAQGWGRHLEGTHSPVRELAQGESGRGGATRCLPPSTGAGCMLAACGLVFLIAEEGGGAVLPLLSRPPFLPLATSPAGLWRRRRAGGGGAHLPAVPRPGPAGGRGGGGRRRGAGGCGREAGGAGGGRAGRGLLFLRCRGQRGRRGVLAVPPPAALYCLWLCLRHLGPPWGGLAAW